RKRHGRRRARASCLPSSMQRAAQVLLQVLRVFEPDRKPNRALGDACLAQVLGRHSKMRRRRGMDDERFCVADIRKMREKLERLDKATSPVARTFEVEAEDRPAATRQKLLREHMVRMFRQIRISDRANQRMLAQ